MRIAVCDDQAEFRSQILVAIRQCAGSIDILLDPYKDGRSFLQAFQKRPYDLVFLDIEMPEIDGITLARMLRSLHKDVPIVFLTSHIEYALEGYEVNALRYLTKPVDLKKLKEVLSYMVKQMQEQRTLWVKTELCEKRILIRDILYMESQNQNVLICAGKESHCVRYNLSDYEKELMEDDFFRIHRGYLVSLRHVKSIGKSEVTMDNGTVLPVSRSKEKPLKEALFRCIRKEAF